MDILYGPVVVNEGWQKETERVSKINPWLRYLLARYKNSKELQKASKSVDKTDDKFAKCALQLGLDLSSCDLSLSSERI